MEKPNVKYPVLAKVFLVLYFLAEFIILPAFTNFIFEINLAQYLRTLVQPLVLIYVLVYLTIGVLYIRFFTKLIETHDGDVESAQITNKKHFIVGYSLIAIASANPFIFSPLFCRAYNSLSFGREIHAGYV